MKLRAGVTVADRYKLERLIGSGGMGAVWSATHLVTGKDVALKVLSPQHAEKPEARERFVREARLATLVRHANVVSIHDIVEHAETLVMVMDLLLGENLGERLDRDGSLPLKETARIMLPVVSAVGTAHASGVVHRDLKPENIFLVESPRDVRVLDFGIAKLTEQAVLADGSLTNTGALLGTPYYMSPEQVFGEKDVDGRADVWAVGVILYECLAGERPFEAENAGQIMKAILTRRVRPLEDLAPDVPREVCALVTSMLERERADRLADLREAYEVLSRHTDIISQRFSRPRFSQPPHISIAPDSASDPYAPTLTPHTWDDLPSAQISWMETAKQKEPAASEPLAGEAVTTVEEPAPLGRRSGRPELRDTANPFELPATRGSRAGRMLGAVAAVVAGALVVGGAWRLFARPDNAAGPPGPATSGDPSGAQGAVVPPSSTLQVSSATTSSAPDDAPPSAPSASSTAMHAKQQARPVSPSATVATPTPKTSALPHGVQGKVPF